MKGRAPNSPDTGSQTSPSQKPNPNFWIDRADSRHSSKPMPATSTTISMANTPVPNLKPRSRPLSQLRMGPTLRDLDRRQGRQLELHDLRRQRGVAEVGGELLAVGERPLHEL